uniref:Uncharacterized protein n=1 Tax=Arion vulgaris TaxID=1028688 RepID=A0A0B7AWX4_9EUPU
MTMTQHENCSNNIDIYFLPTSIFYIIYTTTSLPVLPEWLPGPKLGLKNRTTYLPQEATREIGRGASYPTL